MTRSLAWCVLRLLPLVLIVGCDDSGRPSERATDDAGVPPVSDAGPDTGPFDANLPDEPSDGGLASFDAGDPPPSPVGIWTTQLRSALYRISFRYELLETGEARISRVRIDSNGELAGCRQFDDATGTWTVEGDQLDVLPLAGRTRREVNAFESRCGIGGDFTYEERDMTEAELRETDLADGMYSIEGERLRTEAHGLMFSWTRGG